MEYRRVREGEVEIYVPNVELPEKGRKYGFYNPEMKTDRDISVATLSVFKKIFSEISSKEIKICDLLCATGIRGIRYKKEIGGEVTINDVNENAIELAKRNVDLNGLNVTVRNEDANLLLAKERFDVIDIDPFGSPVYFVGAAARSLTKFSFLCVTATDTATLFGVHPETCRRRYGALSIKCQFSKELGTRILLSFLIKEFAKYGKCFTPILSYSKRHYVRIFGMVEKSGNKINKILNQLKLLSYYDGLWQEGIKNGMKPIGEIYLGETSNKEFCNKIIEEVKKRGLEGIKILNMITDEIDEPFYYDIRWIAKRYKIKMLPIEEIISWLRQMGFKASRTAFCDFGIKTNARAEDIKNIKKIEGL
ncbi:MAG: tRNA (guanine(10)-N(2))-dimethyltransferase [Candidatus Aenigmatarchaeota archaeon]